MRLAIAICGLLFFIGCTDRPGPVGGSPIGPGRFSHSAVKQSVAPWDGMALHLYLAEHPLTDPAKPEPCVLVAVYHPPSTLSGKRVRIEGKMAREGAAHWLTADRQFTPVTAEVEFGEVRSGQPVSGTYDLTLADGTRERGRFEANWWPGDGPGG